MLNKLQTITVPLTCIHFANQWVYLVVFPHRVSALKQVSTAPWPRGGCCVGGSGSTPANKPGRGKWASHPSGLSQRIQFLFPGMRWRDLDTPEINKYPDSLSFHSLSVQPLVLIMSAIDVIRPESQSFCHRWYILEMQNDMKNHPPS